MGWHFGLDSAEWFWELATARAKEVTGPCIALQPAGQPRLVHTAAGWLPRVRTEACVVFWGLSSELAQCCFCSMWLAKASHETNPGSSSWWEEVQSHFRKPRYSEKGDLYPLLQSTVRRVQGDRLPGFECRSHYVCEYGSLVHLSMPQPLLLDADHFNTYPTDSSMKQSWQVCSTLSRDWYRKPIQTYFKEFVENAYYKKKNYTWILGWIQFTTIQYIL